MTKIDIFSGFLGAGKTTLIKKLIAEAYKGEQVVLIENEFGEIGIDGLFLQDAGINITEMNSGCICCSLVGDFSRALKKVYKEYSPDRIIIEPSGVGKLSDIVAAVQRAAIEGAEINALCVVVDASRCKMYMKNFGEFFNDQIRSANCIVMSHTEGCSEEKIAVAAALIREQNADAVLITTPTSQLTGADILSAMENRDTLALDLERLVEEQKEHRHHHHDDDDDDGDEEECHHHHHHDDDDDVDDGDEEECHRHHHHDDDDDGDEEECHHHHHHHHHADEVFTSFGLETTRKFTRAELEGILKDFSDEGKYGVILRAKGVVASAETDGGWYHYDYVPGEADVRLGSPAVTGRLCVIGCKLNEDALREIYR